MQGQYAIERKIRDLPEGFEFKNNRFITDKNKHGCYVTYKSQDGSIKYLMDRILTDSPEYYPADKIVNVEVDFVPDALRVRWTELQKLGKCYLSYNPQEDLWTVCFPENPDLPINSETAVGDNQSKAIYEACDLIKGQIIHNGYRWFDCRDLTNFKKISDDEAKKLQKEIAGT